MKRTGNVGAWLMLAPLVAMAASGCRADDGAESELERRPLTAVVQVNSGGGAVSPYVADRSFSGGNTYSSGNTITTAGVTNAAPASVYQTERWGTFSYTITGLTAGTSYTVRLHFAEIYWNAAGQRVFNVAINGAAVLSNFDIFATAGANKAVVRDFTATANGSGQIVVSYTNVVDNAKSSAIEVLSGTTLPADAGTPDSAPPPADAAVNQAPTVASGATANPNPVTGTTSNLSVLGADDGGEANLTYTWATTGTPPAAVSFSANGTNAAKNTTATFSAAGTYNLGVTIKDGPGLTTTSNVTVTVNASGGGTAVYRINAGDGAVSPFGADQFANAGSTYSTATAVSTTGVANAAPAAVYQSERYGNFTYTFPSLTANASYTVRLHFAEIYWNTAGQRVFNVFINGTQVLTNFDIFAAAGSFKAVVRDFTATANAQGQIAVQYASVQDLAKASGLEIISGSAPPPPNNAPPTVSTPASASPNPVTGTTTSLNTLGADDGGASNLTYTWATTGTPPAAVSFSPNGTNAARASTATFTKAGTYTLQATIRYSGGLTTTTSVNVTVNATFTALAVSPASASVRTGATQMFSASGTDQFGNATTTPAVTWSVSGGGSINSSGLFTAGSSAGGPFTVTATGGGKTGTATVTVTTTSSSSLLLRADPTKRFLVDGNGQPFLIWGEAAWLLGVQKKVPEQNAYLDDRAAKGINAIELMAVSRYQDGDPNDADGVRPFTTPGDFATFNPTYFNKIADVVARAAAHNMVVFLAPMWAGYDSNQGFYDTVVANGTTKCRNYGAAIAQVFAQFDNIVWVMGGDKPGTSFSTAEYAAMTDGIKSVDTRHLITAHWNFAPSDSHPGPWEQIAGCYDWNGGTVYAQVQSEYNENDSPAIVLESLYELNNDFGYTPKILRFQTIGSMLSGSKGYFWGHEGIWQFGSSNLNVAPQSRGAPYDLNSPGMGHYQRSHTLFASRNWQSLVPDTSNSLVTAGRGGFGGTSYVTAAKTPDGKLGMAHIPNGGSITVNLGQMAMPVTARWFDPTNGNFSSAGSFSTPQSRTFTVPGNNAAGDNDWTLVLESP